jgi:pyruvate,water dikinase
MVNAAAAGVAFTAHPVTGDRDQTLVTAVAGIGESLVSGHATGEEWTMTRNSTVVSRPARDGGSILTPTQAKAVAALAQQVGHRYGSPQDIEWVIDESGQLWLVQARPMTAVPDHVSWTAPGPGLWMRNFRLGEWLPEAVTPLFATWLLPLLEDGYLTGMHATIGVRVPFPHALVNGWYYNTAPTPSPALLAHVLLRGRRRAMTTLYNALVRVSRDPAAADHAVLSKLDRQWRDEQLPRYRRLVLAAEAEADIVDPPRLVALVDLLGREAGAYLWYLAIVGGSAWKMESCLTRFIRRHLGTVLSDDEGGAQVLLRGLGSPLGPGGHAVQSIDWYHALADGLPASPAGLAERYAILANERAATECRCVAGLADQPGLLDQFQQLLRVNQRYAMTREEQARDFTLAWPILRRCAIRLGDDLVRQALIADREDVFFCTRAEVEAALAGAAPSLAGVVTARRRRWEGQRRIAAPLTLGRPRRAIGDLIERSVQQARGAADVSDAALIGHPASAGRATGRVRIVHSLSDFAAFGDGDILVAKATTPAWTPLFQRAAAVVTDSGSLAAHASLIAREYGIPAVVATGTATHQLRPGQLVTVDGTTGTVLVHDEAP